MNGRLYDDIAGWWPVISPPAEYAEEAALYVDMIREATHRPVREVLELGSGGGNNASHMNRSFALTLVEPSDGMRFSYISQNICATLPAKVNYLSATCEKVFEKRHSNQTR